MNLVAVTLKCFRGYSEPTRIELGKLTAFVGKNDIGKSTILEALEVFFNNSTVKLEEADLCVHAVDKVIEISCEFDSWPERIILDAQSSTTLSEEFLLNARGNLEIVKLYDCSGSKIKESIYARANHPTNDQLKDLLQKKISDLKITATACNAQPDDNRSSSSIRRAIRLQIDDVQFEESLVPLNENDAKQVWESLKKELPGFALFQSDRASKDEDGEVQNPLKLAVAEAIKSVEDKLNEVRDAVQEKALEVAERTLKKLQELDPTLAAQLTPSFKSEPNYAAGFKLSLAGDDDIPVNKRGSGVRRLILLSFFRAEAEMRQSKGNYPGMIYAIEEPENSQHPNYQKMLIDAFVELSEREGVQVVLTTHVPGVAALLPSESLRLVQKSQAGPTEVKSANEDALIKIADDLGVLPDNRVRVLLYLEGPHDVSFLDRVASVLKATYPDIPIPSEDSRIGIIVTGGGNLKHWVNHRYLRNLQKPEVHIYDRDEALPPKYQVQVDQVIANGHTAFLTDKREMENYLHVDAINDVFGHALAPLDWNIADIPALIAEAVHTAAPGACLWADLDDDKKGKKISRAKVRLNTEVADRMDTNRLSQTDPAGEVRSWLLAVMNHF